MEELTTSEVWSRTYLVRPAVYPPDVNNVMILSPERVSSGAMDEVWSSVARPDGERGVAASTDCVLGWPQWSRPSTATDGSLRAVLGLPDPADSLRADSVASTGGSAPTATQRRDSTRRVP